jgi:hypothetical protein
MSWLEVVNKNSKEFESSEKNPVIEQEEINIDLLDSLILKDPEDEFERLYFSKIIDLKIDFSDYLQDEALPFLDSFNRENDYSFYNFIKYHSHNYYNIIENVNKENDEIVKQEQEQNEEDILDFDLDS